MPRAIEVQELYVISDLHLGGEKDFQIFGSSKELEWLIDHIARREVDNIALLINGDIIDFLAEPIPTYFDVDASIHKLNQLFARDEFKRILKSIKFFLTHNASNKRQLVINLGNHDLELALPWVRDHFVSMLTDDDPFAMSRLRMVTDGTGALFKVGSVRVLAIHGNEVDSDNVTDHERIRRIARDLTLGCPVRPWVPNAGTGLVIDAMNDIKRKYPFVDLLKPEVEAVVPVLLALEPSLVRKIDHILARFARKGRDWVRMNVGLLGADDDDVSTDELVRGRLAEPASDRSASQQKQACGLLDSADRNFRQGIMPTDLLAEDRDKDTLGYAAGLFSYFVKGESKVEALREALIGLSKDRSFDSTAPDNTFERIDHMVASSIGIIVAGHTHLERSHSRRQAAGLYFNSGTWARLIRLDEAILDEKRFKRAIKILRSAKITDLDKEPELVMRRNPVVMISALDGEVQGVIGHVKKAADRFSLQFDDATRRCITDDV